MLKIKTDYLIFINTAQFLKNLNKAFSEVKFLGISTYIIIIIFFIKKKRIISLKSWGMKYSKAYMDRSRIALFLENF